MAPRCSLMYSCTGNIDPGILFEEDRIKTFYLQSARQVLGPGPWAYPDLQGGADIIIQEHTCEAAVSFLEESFDHVRRGGIYVYRRYWAGPAGKQLFVRF